MLPFHLIFPLISLPAFTGAFFGKTASFKFCFLFFCFLIIFFICLLSFHSSFSETAILRNILFMCIGGWVSSSDRRTIRAKNKWKGQPVLLMHFILFWKCSKTGSTVPGSVGWCCFILFTFATFLCSFLSVLGWCFPLCYYIFVLFFVSLKSCRCVRKPPIRWLKLLDFFFFFKL